MSIVYFFNLLQKNLSNFENSLKQFGCFVPVLNYLHLCIGHNEVLKIKIFGLELFDSKLSVKSLILYFKNLKNFTFDESFVGM